jgi:hypothetical protein
MFQTSIIGLDGSFDAMHPTRVSRVVCELSLLLSRHAKWVASSVFAVPKYYHGMTLMETAPSVQRVACFAAD